MTEQNHMKCAACSWDRYEDPGYTESELEFFAANHAIVHGPEHVVTRLEADADD